MNNELHGYDFILATTEAHNSKGIIPAYDKPFLEVITHHSLLDCLSIESYVSTLYTSFGGTNGDRAIRYLSDVCQSLMGRGKETSEFTSVISLDTVKLLLNALYQLLSRVRRARFHDELPVLLNLARELASKITEECSKADLDGLQSRIEVIQSLVTSASRNLVTPRVHEGDP